MHTTRLLAIARGLEDDGQYNVAKLFRAAALGEAVRAARERPRAGAGLAEAMAAAIDELRAAGRDERLLRLMERGAAAALAGDWITLDEVPDPWICRDCGHVLTHDIQRGCPECGARALTLLHVTPIYYLEPLTEDEVGPALGRGLADVAAATAGVGAEAVESGVWPMREIIAHLVASEKLLVDRARRMLSEDEPLLVSVAPDEITAGVAAVEPTFEGLLAAYVAERMSTLDLVAVLVRDDWQRGGYHPEWGRITVLQQLSYLARHEAGHLAELDARHAGR